MKPNAAKNTLWDTITTHGVWYATEMLARLPEKWLLGLVESRLRKGVSWKEGADFLIKVLEILHRNWANLNPNVRQRFIQNIFGHLMLRGGEKRKRACALFGDYPLLMVISPTMRCNLRCTGCYSYHYSKQDAISTDRLDRLYGECEDLGIHFVVVSGGEPYIREDTLDLFEAHPNIYFLTYTNGTIIADKKLTARLARLGNVMPCVSVEGFKEETDARRGKGTYKKIQKAMQEMREAGILFGFSATPMRHNNELLLSNEFIEHYLNLGCKVGWYFSYMPVGRSPDLDLMPTPSQRLHRYHRIRKIRSDYDIMAADFWCDGLLTGGCLSGGRTYFHVNAQGGVEPCVFHQFYKDNILESSLVDCLKGSYLHHVRCKIREVENPLRPCLIIDNPKMLRDLVAQNNPIPSQEGSDALLSGELADGLDRYANELQKLFDPVFKEVRKDYVWPLEPLGTIEEKKAAIQTMKRA